MALPSVGDLLKSSWSLFKLRWPTFLGILLAPTIVLIVYTLLLPAASGPGKAAAVAVQSTANPILIAVVTILMIIGFWWSSVALLISIKESEHGLSIADSFKRAVPLLIPYLWVSILVGLITMVGFVLLIIPGIIFGLWYYLSSYILVDQNIRGMDALKTSKAYMQGNMGAVFWRCLVGGIAIYIPVIILGMILGAALPDRAAAVVTNLLSLVVAPLISIYIFRLYRAVKAKYDSHPHTSAVPAQPVQSVQ